MTSPKIEKITHLHFPQLNSLEQLYLSKRKTVFLYQFVFIALGTLFTVFSCILSFKIANWSYHVLFFHGEIPIIVLHIMSFLSAALGLTSLTIGCSLRAEKEVARTLYNKAKEKLLYLPSSPLIQDQLKQLAYGYEKIQWVLHEIASKQIGPAQKRDLFFKALKQYELETSS